VPSRVPVEVVRHASERRKVSNTGAVAARVIGGRVVDHGLANAVVVVPDLGDTPRLLFTGGRTSGWDVPSVLVVLDATWRQVRSMRARLPVLAGMPVLSLPDAAPRPRMRRQHLPEGMSTIEAIAAALERLGDPEPAIALRDVHQRMTALWLRLRSRQVQGGNDHC
jgi:DTW domain-containing protein YfiP